MKKNFINLLTILFFFNTTSAQNVNDYLYNYIVNYKKSYKINKNQKEYQEENFTILANNAGSVYRPTGEMLFDSIKFTSNFLNKTKNEKIALSLQYSSPNDEMIKTKFKNKTIEHTLGIFSGSGNFPRYQEVINHNWKLINDSKIILGISCKKATCTLFGRNWTAWYSTQHPIPFGPYKFFGLPGLIISIEDDTHSYKFEAFSIIIRNKLYPKEVFNPIIRTTKTNALKIFDEGKYTTAVFQNGTFDDPTFMKKIADSGREKKKYENNPIELKPFEYNK